MDDLVGTGLMRALSGRYMLCCALAATGGAWAEPAADQAVTEVFIAAPPIPAPESVSGRKRPPSSGPDMESVPIAVTRTSRASRIEPTRNTGLIEQLAMPAGTADDAMRRLIARGKRVLPELHSALLDEQASVMKLARMMQILARIGDESSVLPITRLVGYRHESRYLQKEALKALRQLPASDVARAYADSLLASEDTEPAIKRAALLYYAERPHPRARRWMIQYRSPGVDPSIRYAGLYLAAVLGDKSAMRWILALLESGGPANEQYYLLLGLAELVPLNEFLARVGDLELAPEAREKAVQAVRIRYAEQSEAGPVVIFQDISPVGKAADTSVPPLTVTDGQPAKWRRGGLSIAGLGFLAGISWLLYRRLRQKQMC